MLRKQEGQKEREKDLLRLDNIEDAAGITIGNESGRKKNLVREKKVSKEKHFTQFKDIFSPDRYNRA